jgi:microcin C transport system substrate-binding protein
MFKYNSIISILIAFTLLAGCSGEDDNVSAPAQLQQENNLVDVMPTYPLSELPQELTWVTNDVDPVFSSPDAVKGGTFNTAALSFPLTLRTIGPDSNGGFVSLIRGNQLLLTDIHPNTHNIIPSLASHWAYDEDGKTVYYKLNPAARWSDGKPITADDYMFTLEFMRSEHIVAPWYNNHYTEQILNVKKYDDHTISITGVIPRPDVELHFYYGISPTPRHFHKLDENWVRDYNWKVEPNSGPYNISKVDKGKYIEFELKDDWWARDLKYYKNRFNVRKISVKVIRDFETIYRHFLRGEIDTFGLTLPSYWHDKSQGPEYENGYIVKRWFYNDVPQASSGLYLNMDNALLSDINIRYGLAHSMNIEKMISNVLRGDYYRLHNKDTGYGEYTNKSIRAREFDLEKAEEYFEKSGWQERGDDGIRVKNDRRMSFTITYSTDVHSNRLVFLKEEAKKAGVELNLELLDGTSAFKKFLEKKHQIAWMGWSTGIRPQYWGGLHSDNAHKPQTNNITNTDDPELDEMIDQYKNGTEVEKRIELAHQMQQKVHDIGAYIPTYMVPYLREAHWRWMQLPEVPGTKWSNALFDFTATTSNLGTIGGLFWIDEKKKEETLQAMKDDRTFEPLTLTDETYKIIDATE